MKVLKLEDWGKDVCPICKKKGNRVVVMIPKAGTLDGLNMDIVPVHADCLQQELIYYPDNNVILALCKI